MLFALKFYVDVCIGKARSFVYPRVFVENCQFVTEPPTPSIVDYKERLPYCLMGVLHFVILVTVTG